MQMVIKKIISVLGIASIVIAYAFPTFAIEPTESNDNVIEQTDVLNAEELENNIAILEDELSELQITLDLKEKAYEKLLNPVDEFIAFDEIREINGYTVHITATIPSDAELITENIGENSFSINFVVDDTVFTPEDLNLEIFLNEDQLEYKTVLQDNDSKTSDEIQELLISEDEEFEINLETLLNEIDELKTLIKEKTDLINELKATLEELNNNTEEVIISSDNVEGTNDIIVDEVINITEENAEDIITDNVVNDIIDNENTDTNESNDINVDVENIQNDVEDNAEDNAEGNDEDIIDDNVSDENLT